MHNQESMFRQIKKKEYNEAFQSLKDIKKKNFLVFQYSKIYVIQCKFGRHLNSYFNIELNKRDLVL